MWTEIARFQDSLLSEPRDSTRRSTRKPTQARVLHSGRSGSAGAPSWATIRSGRPICGALRWSTYKRLGILQKYEFRFIVDLSRRHGGRTQGQLKSVLSDIVSKPEMVSLVYKDEEGQDRTYYVRTVAESRFEHTGEEPTASRSSLVFVEL